MPNFDADIELEDWQSACRNLKEIADIIIQVSAKPYVTEVLVEELIRVARCEDSFWQEIKQCGDFIDRDAAADFCQKFKGFAGSALVLRTVKRNR